MFIKCQHSAHFISQIFSFKEILKLKLFFPVKQINGEKSEKNETTEKGKCVQKEGVLLGYY